MKINILYITTLLIAVAVSGCAAESSVKTENRDTPGDEVTRSVPADDAGTVGKTDPPESNSAGTGDAPEKGDSNSYRKNSGDKIDSVYTSLEVDDCKLLEAGEISSEMECPGIAGHKLIVGDYDMRQTVYVVLPDGKKQNLKFNKVVSGSFSYTGDKAEWRVVKENGKMKPYALIIRFIFKVNPAVSSKEASYLTVSKIKDGTACVTDIVKQVKDQNVKARQLADASADKPCLEELSN